MELREDVAFNNSILSICFVDYISFNLISVGPCGMIWCSWLIALLCQVRALWFPYLGNPNMSTIVVN